MRIAQDNISPMTAAYQSEFIDLCVRLGVLRFGSFTLKSGRESPYFFNAGLFNTGDAIAAAGRAYAAALAVSELKFDMLFGPAYKGIPLVSACAIACAEQQGRNLPWAFNRKEAKTHGESGRIVGSELAGRVVIVDDVITAGTAVRESIELIRTAGAQPVAVALALDRQERGQGPLSAVQEVKAEFGLDSVSILTLDGLIGALESRSMHGFEAAQLDGLRNYRQKYGVIP